MLFADVVPVAIVPFAGKADTLHEFDISYQTATPLTGKWYIYCALLVALAGGIWVAETAVICVSVRAIIRYRTTTRRVRVD